MSEDWNLAMSIPDIEKHKGDYVLIANHKIVLITPNRLKVSKEIKEHPEVDYYVVRIPDPDVEYMFDAA